jgi:signal transduction histidine kinase
LHDGAQQGLISLALHLQAARASVPADDDALAGQLDRAVTMLAVVRDELSEIAHGVHPTVLSQGGLHPGLARRYAVPVQLDIRAERRLPEHVELCAYYVIAEALTNTTKHAAASEVHVNVVADDEMLRIEVRDNGRGGANIEGGSGIVGLKDRVDALGGFRVLDSPPGSGTTLAMTLPLNG